MRVHLNIKGSLSNENREKEAEKRVSKPPKLSCMKVGQGRLYGGKRNINDGEGGTLFSILITSMKSMFHEL